MMKNLKIALLCASTLALVGCGEPNDTSGNTYLAIENYTHVEFERQNMTTLATATITIDLVTGNASGTRPNGTPFICTPDAQTRQTLWSHMRQINVEVNNSPDLTCNMIGRSYTERFYDNNTSVEIDWCKYNYVGNSQTLMNEIYNAYAAACF